MYVCARARDPVLTFAYRWAYDPVNREWKMMMVSSRSQIKTLSRSVSGPGDGLLVARRARFLGRAVGRIRGVAWC